MALQWLFKSAAACHVCLSAQGDSDLSVGDQCRRRFSDPMAPAGLLGSRVFAFAHPKDSARETVGRCRSRSTLAAAGFTVGERYGLMPACYRPGRRRHCIQLANGLIQNARAIDDAARRPAPLVRPCPRVAIGVTLHFGTCTGIAQLCEGQWRDQRGAAQREFRAVAVGIVVRRDGPCPRS